MRLQLIKKIVLITFATLSISIVSVQTLKAQGGGGDEIALLQAIANNTYGILQQVSNLQNILNELGKMAEAWILQDNSDLTAQQLVPNFTNLGQLITNDLNTQLAMQTTINNNLLPSNQVNTKNVPYANDLVYSTILGKPLWAKDPRNTGLGKKVDSAMNYILNASGVNITHVPPGLNWQGQAADQDRYQNYYNAVMAAESFNAYVLSQQYADKNQLNDLQNTLVGLASNPTDWMAKVASENIGWVLRQLLLFQSQAFVLLTQLVQSEKQIATASVMTNALIITLNQQWETNFVAKAQGTRNTG